VTAAVVVTSSIQEERRLSVLTAQICRGVLQLFQADVYVVSEYRPRALPAVCVESVSLLSSSDSALRSRKLLRPELIKEKCSEGGSWIVHSSDILFLLLLLLHVQ
jgi:hypothetical protein